VGQHFGSTGTLTLDVCGLPHRARGILGRIVTKAALAKAKTQHHKTQEAEPATEDDIQNHPHLLWSGLNNIET